MDRSQKVKKKEVKYKIEFNMTPEAGKWTEVERRRRRR